MPGLLYPATIPHFLQLLPQMVELVQKAEAHCAEQGMAPQELLEARLADDMWHLSLQFRSCWSHSADAVDSALTGVREVDYTEPPADFRFSAGAAVGGDRPARIAYAGAARRCRRRRGENQRRRPATEF